MRELKFRAWNKEEECWYNFANASFYEKEDGIPNTVFGFDFSNNFIVEQYTGLKDKNGKEIYEGDIVKADGRIYEVAWFEKDGGWFCFRENDSVYTPLYHIECEIIGNIHENPELLEGEKMRYRLVHQCPDCKKIYSDYSWYVRVARAGLICPKCGHEGGFKQVVARRKLLFRWEIKKGKKNESLLQ